MASTTDSSRSVVDESELTVRRTIQIAAPVEKVWSAVTEPEHISRWFGRAELDGTGVGASGTLTWDGQPAVPVRIEEIEPRRRVSYRWGNDDAADKPAPVVDDRSTVFTFTLEPVQDGTRLTVVESGFAATSDPAANLEAHREGWDSELDKLVALLETGSR